ncbi:MAG: HAD-IA family hydrolase [Ignavibacteriales bacterium]|nr:HAD-IA family hydrolase [Ignavibacteriales bacterium]
MKKIKYSVIVFDLGNVLINYNYTLTANLVEKVEKGFGQKFLDFFSNHFDIVKKLEKGEIGSDDFIDKLSIVFENKINKNDICQFYSDVFIPNEEMISLLPQLKSKYKLVLMSNTNEIHKEYSWGKYDFIKYFDKMILSHEVKFAKPEEGIYKAVMKFTQCPPDEHFYIDDYLSFIEAGKEIGWDAVQFTNFNKLMEELKIRSIL